MREQTLGKIPEADVLGYIWPEMIAVCPKCNQTRKRIDFHTSTRTKSGLYSCCKECRKKMDQKRHRDNRAFAFLQDISECLEKWGISSNGWIHHELLSAYWDRWDV